MRKVFLKSLLKIKNGKDHKHLDDGKTPVYGSGGIMRYVNASIYEKESILLPRKGTDFSINSYSITQTGLF